jgi:nicotinic acid mononucleotide adenylyltransferase
MMILWLLILTFHLHSVFVRNRPLADREHASFGTATLLDYLMATTTEQPSAGDDCHNSSLSSSSQQASSSQYTLALGADAFQDLMDGKWKESDRVLQLVHQIVVFARPTESTETSAQEPEPYSTTTTAPKIRWLAVENNGGLPHISSTQARACTDVEGLSTMVPPQILDYILEHQLYAMGEASQKKSS